MRLNRKTAGDTIVEVLISIAIVAGVLAGAFVATNRNVRANQAAQERGEALKIAESQIEKLKAAMISGTATYLDDAGPYCVLDSMAKQTLTAATISTSPACTFNTRYVASITNSGNRNYRIVILWANITGNSTSLDSTNYKGFDKLVLYYRIGQ